MTAAAASAWFVRSRPVSEARIRLVCLPHAGAGATSYFPWGPPLQAAGVELLAVQYPGRESRLEEPLIDSAAEMVAALADAWADLPAGPPRAVFGHSMGAILAYELALELERRDDPCPPIRVFVSGRNPPDLPPNLPAIHDLPDEAFLREVGGRYGNLPPQVLAEPELVRLILPILRSDFRLLDRYRRTELAAARPPFTVFGGTEDPWTTGAELEGWRRCTRGACRVRLIAGGHFFPQQARAAVIANILAELAPPA